MKKEINTITSNGIGIALFVILSLCLQVPIFQNYYLCLGYVVMAVYLRFFGIKNGAIVGVFGTILYCFLINGLRGMPGWSIGNIVIAIILGYAFKFAEKFTKNITKYMIYIIGIVAACTCGILFVKSLVEHLLYSQPIIARIATNIYAFIADIVVLVISIPICKLLEPCMKNINKNKIF